MKTLILILGLFLFSAAETNAQNYYYQSGDPTNTANWNDMPDGSGSPAPSFTEFTFYIIETGKTATVSTPWNFGGRTLYLTHGATLRNNSGIQMDSTSYLRLDSGALYIHNSISSAAQTIFKGGEGFDRYSTVRIENWSSVNEPLTQGVELNLFGYYFGNLEINWTSNTGYWYQYIWHPNIYFCDNNLTINSTGSGRFLFHYPFQNFNEQQVVKIRRNFIQNGGIVDLSTNSVGTEAFGMEMRLYGNFVQNGGQIVTGPTKYGKISFIKPNDSYDSTYQTFYSYSPLGVSGDVQLNVPLGCSLRLLSDIGSIGFSALGGLYVEGGNGSTNTLIDFQYANLVGLISFIATNNCKIFLRSPNGYTGNIGTGGIVSISGFSSLIFAGTEPQVTGSTMPDFFGSIEIANPAGVTLSKNLKAGEIYLTSGTLNLSDYNLTMATVTGIYNAGYTKFINTNGNGFFKTYIAVTARIIPVGNGSYNPVWMIPVANNTPDTFSFRVKNGFYPAMMPSDTSYCVRKTWDIEENIIGGSNTRVFFQWMRSDEGINFTRANEGGFSGTTGIYNMDGYNGYKPIGSSVFEFPFSGPLDTSMAYSSNPYNASEGYFDEFGPSNKYIIGLQRGIYEYYFYNSGNAASLNSWKKNENGTGSSPLNFSDYKVFNVKQNKNAVFNSSASFSAQTSVRLSGNGQLTSNQPVTILGKFEMYDSAAYNHNNIGVAANTIFAGAEQFGLNTTYNITMWSDTANAVRDGLQFTIPGNLIINFSNLIDPGTAGRWRNSGLTPTNTFCRNLTYIQSSGYDLCLVGNPAYGPNFNMNLWGNLKLGDSLIAPDANPVINLSYGTSQVNGSSAGALSVGGNIDIQRGIIKSEENIFMANGCLTFNFFGPSKKHYISSYQPVSQPVFNVGNSLYPSTMNPLDTIILRSNFYNSQNTAGYPSDFFEIPDRAVFDCDTFSFRGMNLRVKNGGKIIIRNKEGMNFELGSLQNITFEEGAMLELAGYEAQNLYKAGTTSIPSVSTLLINNSNGVTLNEIITVTDTLKFIQGKISSALTYLQFTDTTGAAGMSNTAYIEAPVKLFTKSTVSKWVPLGKDGKLRPMNFQAANSIPAQWILQYNTLDPHTIGSTYGPGINNISSNEYYYINNLTPGIGAYTGISYGPESGVTEIESLRVARWNGTFWENKGAINYLGNSNSGYIISDYCSDFGIFVLSSTNAQSLPVEISSFTTNTDKNNVILNWSTTEELNNKGFDVERKSISDTTWKKVSFIAGAGNSNAVVNYKYEDRNLATGKYFYRLKQTDYNGNYKYYFLQNEINVGTPSKFFLSQNYPNPFNPTTKINFELPDDSKVTLQIYDVTGRLVASLLENQSYQAGYHTIQMNGSNLASGTYFYRIAAGDFVQTKKMQLIK